MHTHECCVLAVLCCVLRGHHAMPTPSRMRRGELEERTMQLMSVQRNYESISRLMAVKNNEIEQAGSPPPPGLHISF
jgi:hypothetical protein